MVFLGGGRVLISEVPLYRTLKGGLRSPRHRSTSLIRKGPPPQDPPRTLGIGLLWGPRRRRFLMSEVPLYVAREAHTEMLLLVEARGC